MGTGRRFATAPAPATTPERASGASRTCRFDVCECRSGPLRVQKAASEAAPVRVELRESPTGVVRPRTGRSSTDRSSFGRRQAKRRLQNAPGTEKHPAQHRKTSPSSRKHLQTPRFAVAHHDNPRYPTAPAPNNDSFRSPEAENPEYRSVKTHVGLRNRPRAQGNRTDAEYSVPGRAWVP